MAKSKSLEKKGGIGSEAVFNKTGMHWNDWFKILDKAGAKKMNHKEIVAFIKSNYKVTAWWQQMVTVTYEQARGLRDKHEKPDGFQISKSKTINVSVSSLYRACEDEKLKKLWMPDKGMSLRKSNKNKSMRMDWIDGKSKVEFQFSNKGGNKSQITIQHNKLPNRTNAERMKKYWGENLEKLKLILTS